MVKVVTYVGLIVHWNYSMKYFCPAKLKLVEIINKFVLAKKKATLMPRKNNKTKCLFKNPNKYIKM